MADRSPHRDALRILYILIAGSNPLPQDEPSGAAGVFKGEARLHAFDFWMRYPDYLAEELLDLFEQTGEERYLDAASEIFSSDEPDIRRFPMIRYRFGAYERLDDTLSLLCCRDLVKITGRKSGEKIYETDFLVMPSAFALAKQIVDEFPGLDWYARRSLLIAELAGDQGGAALKEKQYARAEYAETEMGGVIPPITNRVRVRLNSLNLVKGEATNG